MFDDSGLIEHIFAWGRELKGFRRSHVVEAAQCIAMFQHGMTNSSGQSLKGLSFGAQDALMLATEMSIWFWADDCFDERRMEPDELADLRAALSGRAVSSRSALAPCACFRARLQGLMHSYEDYELLLKYSAWTFDGFEIDKRYSAGEIDLTYGEYLENGAKSIGLIPNLLAAWGLLGDGMSKQMKTRKMREVVRITSIISRLQNDLASVRREEGGVDIANALLILRKDFSMQNCERFIAKEVSGYRRLLAELMRDYDASAVWYRFIDIALCIPEHYYANSRRYA